MVQGLAVLNPQQIALRASGVRPNSLDSASAGLGGLLGKVYLLFWQGIDGQRGTRSPTRKKFRHQRRLYAKRKNDGEALMALALVESTPTPEVQADFDAFWTLYPRKEARKDAMKAWSQIPPAFYMPAVVAVAAWRREWARRDTQHIPLAATWLRGERWEDELPRGVAPTSSAHVPFEPTAPGQRSEMPEHVKAMIAKLKGAPR
jgi:hypothetical protein